MIYFFGRKNNITIFANCLLWGIVLERIVNVFCYINTFEHNDE